MRTHLDIFLLVIAFIAKATCTTSESLKTGFEQLVNLLKSRQHEELYIKGHAVWQLVKNTDPELIGPYQESRIVDMLQHSAHETGRVEEAIQLCSYALQNLTDQLADKWIQHFKSRRKFYEEKIFFEDMKKAKPEELDSKPLQEQWEAAEKLSRTSQYEGKCDNEAAEIRFKKLAENPDLFCRLDDRGRHPWLVLAPVKEEIFNLDPLVVMWHDAFPAIYRDQLIGKAEDSLGEAKLASTEQVHRLDIRRAKAAWIPSETFPTISKHIEALTGLETMNRGCEDFQIGYYGVGGHYKPHFDYFGESEEGAFNGDRGNRIATLLLYLNDVEAGGGTSFTDLNIRPSAQKSSAVFWYNVMKNETRDVRTVHSGCPVLRGEKWVMNKWFRVRGQFLHRPCGLNPEKNYSLDDFNLPEWLKFKN